MNQYPTNAPNDDYNDEERLPWEMRLDESAEQYRAFCDYRDMGRASLQSLLQRYRSGYIKSPPTNRLRTLAEWSRVYEWVERRRAWVAFRDEVSREETLQTIREMTERQARDATQLQSAAMAVLDLLAGYDEETGKFKLRPDAEYRVQDIVRMFKVGFEAERVARGEAASIIEERRQRRDMTQLSDAELDDMIGDDEEGQP